MSEPIRDLETAVRELGALPMPVGPEPQESDTFRFTLYIEGATDREDASWAAEQAVSAVEGQGYKAFTAVAAEDAHYRAAFEAQQSRAETLDRLLRTAQDRVAELEENLRAVNAGWGVARARLAEYEQPAVEAKRDEIRQSYAELIATAEGTKDFEGAFDVQCRLREREEQWQREDAADRPGMRHAVRTIGPDEEASR